MTAGTYLKQRLFHTRKQLDMLQQSFFDVADKFGWRLQAWCFFPNHYHFMAFSETENTLSRLINEFHLSYMLNYWTWERQGVTNALSSVPAGLELRLRNHHLLLSGCEPTVVGAP